jgi:hypothetical protein
MSIYCATKAWVDDMVKKAFSKLWNASSHCANGDIIVLAQVLTPKFLEGNYCPRKSSCIVCSVKNDSFCQDAATPPVYFFKHERICNNIAFKSARQFAMEDDCIEKYAGMFFISELLDCGAIEQLNAKIGCDNYSIEIIKTYCGPMEAIRYAPECPEIDRQIEYIYVKEKLEIIIKKNNK